MQNLIIDFIIFCVITRYIIERRGRGSPHPTYTVFNSNSECKLESYDIIVTPPPPPNFYICMRYPWQRIQILDSSTPLPLHTHF